MAFRAGHIRMAPGQWQASFGVVIERRRCPSQRIVAIGAVGLSAAGHELPSMRVAVTRFALLRRSRKPGFVGRAGFVAIGARHGAVSAKERKLCL